jgi:hypothetical protein
MVMRLPDVPDRVKSPTVCVVPPMNKIVEGCVELVMSSNVFDPVMVSVPAPPWIRLAA